MRAAVLIMLKDLRQRVRDRSVFLWGIVAPLGLAAIFSLVLGGITDTDNIEVTYGVVDADGGPDAGEFVRRLEAIPGFEIVPMSSEEEADRRTGDGEVDATFVVPAGFSEAVRSRGAASLLVIGNVDSPTLAQVARSIAGGFVGQINTVRASVAAYAALSGEEPDPETEGAVLDLPPPIVLTDAAAASKQLSAATFYSAAMAILFLFLTVQFGVLGLLEERHNQTMRRLLAAPISRRSIIVGKALTSFVIGLASMGFLVVGTTLLLGAEWGDPLGVASLVLAGVIAAMGIMFVVAAFARTPEQAGNLQSILAFVLAMLGGAFFPIPAEGVLGRLSLLTPHAWFLRGLGDLSAGGGVEAAFPAALYVVLFGIVTGGIAQFRIGRVVRP